MGSAFLLGVSWRVAWSTGALFCGLSFAQPAPLPGLPDPHHELKGETLIRALRGGGYSLYFRHAVRDTSRTEGERLVMADCTTQIPLADIGRGQSRSIGEAMRKLGVPIGEVVASPYCRTMETARLIAGKVRADNAVAGRNPEDVREPTDYGRLAAMMTSAPEAGTNRIVVGHHGGFFEGLAGGPGLIEGEAAVFRTVDGKRLLVARVLPEDWRNLAHSKAVQANSAVDAQLALRGLSLAAALRAGGYTLYSRTESANNTPQARGEFHGADCAAKSYLSAAGRDQMERIGVAISTLRLRLSQVDAAPTCHALEAARLAGGRPADGVSTPGFGAARSAADVLAHTLASPPPALSTRMVLGDGEDFLAIVGAPPLAAGETAVMRVSEGGGRVVVARLRDTDWEGLLVAAGFKPTQAPRSP